jgi:tripartite-type tricarboxylate transporter receptor subunit TctC
MNLKTVRYLVAFAAAAAVVAGSVPGVQAQAWPTKPIKIIVPFPPGNTMDIMSRLIAPKLQERLGQPVIVENRPGASGMLGLDLVVKSPPDGYTIGAGQGGNLCVLPHTSKNVPYDALKDFAPIAVSTTNYLVIFANTSQPFKTLPEMIAYAKANPGKLTVASNGEGGFPHLASSTCASRRDSPITTSPTRVRPRSSPM